MTIRRRPSLMMRRLWNEVRFVETIAGGRWFLFLGGGAPQAPGWENFLICKGFFLGEGIGGAAPKPPGGGRHIAAAPLHSPGSKGGYPLHPLESVRESPFLHVWRPLGGGSVPC